MAFEENTKPLTTAAGAPVVDNQNSMSAGQRGPLLLQDLWLIEKLAHFRWVATRRLVAAARATSVVLRARRGDRSGPDGNQHRRIQGGKSRFDMRTVRCTPSRGDSRSPPIT